MLVVLLPLAAVACRGGGMEQGVDIKTMPPCQKPTRGGRKRRRGT